MIHQETSSLSLTALALALAANAALAAPLAVDDVAPRLFLEDQPQPILIFGTGFTQETDVVIDGFLVTTTTFVTENVLAADVPGTFFDDVGPIQLEVVDGLDAILYPGDLEVQPPEPQRGGVAGQIEQQCQELLDCSRAALDRHRQQSFEDIITAPDNVDIRQATKRLKRESKKLRRACEKAVRKTYRNLSRLAQRRPPG